MRQHFSALLMGTLLAAASAFGQASDGNITGSVLDASSAAVPNATVQLQNVDTGVKLATQTDSNGSYRFGNVIVGRYNITVSAGGFTTTSVKDLLVELNKTTTANVTL